MYTSSPNTPLRNAFLTSSWCRFQSKFTATDNNTLMELSFATGANVSS